METTNNSNWGTWIIGLVILAFLFFYVFNDDKDTRNCDVEKSTIIQTAATQDLVNKNASATQMVVVNDGNKTREKIDFYAYEEVKDKLACERAKNAQLEGIIYNDRRFNAIESTLSSISCQMLKEPPVYGNACVPRSRCLTGCNDGVA